MNTYSQFELKKMLLQDITKLVEEGCEDESQWNNILDTDEFRDMAEQTDFREKAQDIFYGKRFTENIAKLIADSFGSGSAAVKIRREKRWTVRITGFYLSEDMREKFFGENNSRKITMFRSGNDLSSELSDIFGRLILLRRAMILIIILLVVAGIAVYGFAEMISDIASRI